ncbi:mycothiol synthase [Corynebacterium ulceribovis]|uniref:mycothiol synthase n=1 Tax=Corynebacterium ulceribovis TaxID=487732 RepID=UPI000381CB8E|nr:mycothiol synthase [Corynebacterium ulceribovis]
MTVNWKSVAPARAEEIAQLCARAAEQDGVEPLSEAFLRGLTEPALRHRHILLASDGAVINPESTAPVAAILAIAPGTPVSAELVVDPAFRRRGLGSILLDVVASSDGAQVWAHGDIAAAQSLAATRGMRKQRELLQMSRDLSVPVEVGETPAGVELLSWPAAAERWGADFVDKQWLKVNNEAFHWHPEQGGWSLADLNQGRDTAWFDASDVLLVWQEGTQELLGFHWLKRHAADAGSDGKPFGEVYVIGLADAARGRGIGSWLTRVGMARLQQGGLDRIVLYVEGDNAAAVRSYENNGFIISRRDCTYVQ